MKDNKGHGSDKKGLAAHVAAQTPTITLGKTAIRVPEQLNAWGQTAETAKQVRHQIKQYKKQKAFMKRGGSLP